MVSMTKGTKSIDPIQEAKLNLIRVRQQLLTAYTDNISPTPSWRGSLPPAILKAQETFINGVIAAKRVLGNEIVKKLLLDEK
jgi:predicted secreted Zn-dependent protease